MFSFAVAQAAHTLHGSVAAAMYIKCLQGQVALLGTDGEDLSGDVIQAGGSTKGVPRCDVGYALPVFLAAQEIRGLLQHDRCLGAGH